MSFFDGMPPLLEPQSPYRTPGYIPPPANATYSYQEPMRYGQQPAVASPWGGHAGLPSGSIYPGWAAHPTSAPTTPYHTVPQAGYIPPPTQYVDTYQQYPPTSYQPMTTPIQPPPTSYQLMTTPIQPPPPQMVMTPMVMSNSVSAGPYLTAMPYAPQGAPLRRTASYGASTRPELARRPGDWRADYTPKTGIAALIPRRRSNSINGMDNFSDPVRRTLHPLIRWESAAPPIFYDLRTDPLTLQFLKLNRHFEQTDLFQHATDPPAASMRLYHPALPWFIDIHACSASGITIHQLFDQMSEELLKPIGRRDYYNEELGEVERARLDEAFRERCAGDPALVSGGVRRVDFLRRRVIFEGLAKGSKGMWEMKLRKLE